MSIINSENIGTTENFYWYEATKNSQFIPANKAIVANIHLAAHYLESIRRLLGRKPLFITSWYRTPAYNRKIGGSNKSFHLTGKAIDFYCKHLSPKQIYEILDESHGELGGLGLYPGHIHIDIRGEKARWVKKSY